MSDINHNELKIMYGSFEEDKNALIYSYYGEHLRVETLGENSLQRAVA